MIKDVVTVLAGVMLATTLVLPGRITPQVLDKGLGGAAKLTNAVIGRG